ncbi:MAG: BLUF domain-containing protein [Moraxellaceae bacterium]|nr:MAG: BLUF domain-containing protein [Moraxellaceae bacterium]
MTVNVRLVYTSTATAQPAEIRNDLQKILAAAQKNNFNHQLTGVLLYGNNYFLQCIEGSKAQVDSLYQKLSRDPLHQDIKMLSYAPIETKKFGQWAMRYVHFDAPIAAFFGAHQLGSFNPYLLTSSLVDPFLDVLACYASSCLDEPNLALQLLENNQSRYVMSLKDMAMVAGFILLVLAPLYLVVSLMPTGAGFFFF